MTEHEKLVLFREILKERLDRLQAHEAGDLIDLLGEKCKTPYDRCSDIVNRILEVLAPTSVIRRRLADRYERGRAYIIEVSYVTPEATPQLVGVFTSIREAEERALALKFKPDLTTILEVELGTELLKSTGTELLGTELLYGIGCYVTPHMERVMELAFDVCRTRQYAEEKLASYPQNMEIVPLRVVARISKY
jgi:hypothetical protein